MKKLLKHSILSLILVIALLFTSSGGRIAAEGIATEKLNESDKNAEVTSKEEVIYATLDGSGKISEIYAVNILNVVSGGVITDYGTYSDVKNLTNTQVLNYQEDMVNTYAENGRFYYQGTLVNNVLPWDINIIYTLDGNEITPEELAGSTGRVDIKIETKESDPAMASFYENYLLQVGVTLNTDLCKNITAEGATIANAGKNQLITYTIMPNTEGNISVSADVKDFEMEGVTFSAVPFSMNLELPDTTEMSSGLISLSDAIALLNNGVKELKEGADSMKDGAVSLKDGSEEFKDGLKELDDGSANLVGGSKSILDALTYINTNLKDSSSDADMSALSQLPSGLTQLSGGLDELSKGITELSTGYGTALKALDEAIATIPKDTIREEELQELMVNNPGNETLNLLVENYEASQTVKETYKSVSAAFEAVQTNLPEFGTSIDTISGTLKSIESQVSTSLGDNDITTALSELTDGIDTLVTNYGQFHTGLQEYTGGVSQLNQAYTDINQGIQGLSSGTGEISEGIHELAGGTEELNRETQDMPEQMEATVDDLIADYDKSGYVPSSFISPNNKNVISVQFVIKTDKIEKIVVEQPVITQKEPETLWTRLKALFI